MATKEQYFEAIEHALSLPCPPDLEQYLSLAYLTGEDDRTASKVLHRRYHYSGPEVAADTFLYSHPAYWLTGGKYELTHEFYPDGTLDSYWRHSENFDYTNNKPKSQT